MESARSSHAPPSPPAQCRPSFKQTRTNDIIARPPYRPESRVEVPGRYYRRVHADQGFSAQTPGGPLRVLLVIKCLGYGGAERLLVDMVAVGDRRRFDYEVAYVLRDLDALVPSVVGGGTPVHALGAAHNADLRWMAALRRLLVKGHYDVVHFHLPYAAALGQLVVASLPRSARPGVVYTEHSLWDREPFVIRALLRASMGKGERLVTVSQASHDALPAPLRRRAQTVVHGVDLSRSDSLMARRDDLRADVRAELGVEPGELLFMTVANLRPEKGYQVLLDAARTIADRGLPLRIAAVGRGPLEHHPPRTSRRTGAGRPVPVPRPARRRAGAAGGGRCLCPALSARRAPGDADGGHQRRATHCGHLGGRHPPDPAKTRSTPSWCRRATRAPWSRP